MRINRKRNFSLKLPFPFFLFSLASLKGEHFSSLFSFFPFPPSFVRGEYCSFFLSIRQFWINFFTCINNFFVHLIKIRNIIDVEGKVREKILQFLYASETKGEMHIHDLNRLCHKCASPFVIIETLLRDIYKSWYRWNVI